MVVTSFLTSPVLRWILQTPAADRQLEGLTSQAEEGDSVASSPSD